MTLETIIKKRIDCLENDLQHDRETMKANLDKLHKICKACGEQKFEDCKWGIIIDTIEDITEQIRLCEEVYDKHYDKKFLLDRLMFKYEDAKRRDGE